MPKSALALNLRRARTAANMSREVLAVKAGLSSATVARIELDRFSPLLVTLEALADALGCTVTDLLADEVKAS